MTLTCSFDLWGLFDLRDFPPIKQQLTGGKGKSRSSPPLSYQLRAVGAGSHPRPQTLRTDSVASVTVIPARGLVSRQVSGSVSTQHFSCRLTFPLPPVCISGYLKSELKADIVMIRYCLC